MRPKKMRRIWPTLAFATLVGCTTPPNAPSGTPGPSQSYSCLLPSEQRMLIAELFFGRSTRNRRPVTDADWDDFTAQVITPAFPDGFTVFDGEGQWRNPASGTIGHERTKILLVAVPRSPELATRLTAVIDAYKARFRQHSVGIITRDACAAF